jgi:hypothetical protein
MCTKAWIFTVQLNGFFSQLFSAIFLSLVSLIPELYFRSCGLYRSLRMASLLENYPCMSTPPGCTCTHCAKGSMHAQVLIQMSVKYCAADACHGNLTSKIPTRNLVKKYRLRDTYRGFAWQPSCRSVLLFNRVRTKEVSPWNKRPVLHDGCCAKPLWRAKQGKYRIGWNITIIL